MTLTPSNIVQRLDLIEKNLTLIGQNQARLREARELMEKPWHWPKVYSLLDECEKTQEQIEKNLDRSRELKAEAAK